MDKAKILRECTRIEEIVTEAYKKHRGLNFYELREVINKIKDISSEVSEQPKSNADRIRQMTDAELANMLDIYDVEEVCDYCAKHNTCCHNHCYDGILEWLKQEVSEDAGTD